MTASLNGMTQLIWIRCRNQFTFQHQLSLQHLHRQHNYSSSFQGYFLSTQSQDQLQQSQTRLRPLHLTTTFLVTRTTDPLLQGLQTPVTSTSWTELQTCQSAEIRHCRINQTCHPSSNHRSRCSSSQPSSCPQHGSSPHTFTFRFQLFPQVGTSTTSKLGSVHSRSLSLPRSQPALRTESSNHQC